MEKIYRGSKVRVLIPLVDVLPEGSDVAIPLGDAAGISARIVKPDCTEVEDVELGVHDPDKGILYWEGVVDQAGTWRAQGELGGYISDWLLWQVEPNP